MAKASSVISRKGKLCSVAMNQISSRTMAAPMRAVDHVPAGQHDRPGAHRRPDDAHQRPERALHARRQLRLQLAEGDHRAREGDGADDDAQAHLEAGEMVDVAVGVGDAEIGRATGRRPPPRTRRPGPPASGTRPRAAASPSSRSAAPPCSRCRRRSRCRPGSAGRRATPGCGRSSSETRMAMVIPIMPKRLPCRLVAGELRPRSARMKQMAATR